MRRTLWMVAACIAVASIFGGNVDAVPAAPSAQGPALVSVKAGDRLDLLGTIVDLTEHGAAGWYDAVAAPTDLDRLQRLGFEYRVRIPDLVAQDAADRRAEAAAQALDPSQRNTYRKLADYGSDMDALVARAPDLARSFTLPYPTHQGRTVRGIEISAGVATAAIDGRPAVLVDGVHHAREWPSGELAIMLAEDLVAGYQADDPGIRDLLARVRVVIVPVVNPDGFVRSREIAPDEQLPSSYAADGRAYHRKNMRRNPNGSLGVDPNRNYPYLWGGPGASGDMSDDTYRGPAPGSEPETANIRWLAEGAQVVAYASNHTFGDMILRPWGHTHDDAPDEPLLADLGARMAAHNRFKSCKGRDLYATTGTSEDWAYAASGALAYTFEVGAMMTYDTGVVAVPCEVLDASNTYGGRFATGLGPLTPLECGGFHPRYDLCVRGFYARSRGAYLELIRTAADPATHAVITGTAAPGTTISFSREVIVPTARGGFPESFNTTVVAGPSGTFTAHVNPSSAPGTIVDVGSGARPASDLETYEVTAARPDGSTTTVSVRADRGGDYTLAF